MNAEKRSFFISEISVFLRPAWVLYGRENSVIKQAWRKDDLKTNRPICL